MKSIVNYLFLFLPAIAMAGGMDSGGGQGFVCFKTEEINKSVQLNNGNILDDQIDGISMIVTLDLYEARLQRGTPPVSPTLVKRLENEGYQAYLDRIIERIAAAYPELGEKIKVMKDNFSGDHLIWSPIGLTKVTDNGSVLAYDSNFCTTTTLAIQFKEESSYYLNIDPRLFEHPLMTEEGRAILLLHEFLYAIARDNGKTSSRSARMAIGYLIRDNIATKDIEENLVKLNFLQY
jgi:hypothetical protein